MEKRELIATYFANARLFVKQGNPKAARAYVIAILEDAAETYRHADTILLRVQTAAFLDRWIKVSRELYSNGITDYVLECFGLLTKPQKPLPQPRKEEPGHPKTDGRDPENVPGPAKDSPASGSKVNPGVPTRNPADIPDYAGLEAESERTQGWCAAVFDKNKRAVVEIHASGTGSGKAGTGFIISKCGWLLTNDHVVYDEDSHTYCSTIHFSFSGNKKRYKLTVLASDRKADVALCRFDPDKVGPFDTVTRIRDYSQTLPGADCLVIGNAFDMGLAPFSGMVRYTKDDSGNLVYTAPSNPGDSGGPVFNRKGECIGINKSRTTKVDANDANLFANATPMDRIDKLLKKWCDSNDITL